MNIIANSIAIIGRAPLSANLALRRVLKYKDFDGPLFVIDYSGRGAAILNKQSIQNMRKRSVSWLDIADRCRPINLFHLKDSRHFREVLFHFLCRLKQFMNLNVSDSTLSFIVEVGYRLSKQGSIGLMTLLKTLSNEKIRRWFFDKRIEQDQIVGFLNCISWMMHFPIVFALSESNNRVDFAKHLEKRWTIWIEMKMEHFEAAEHLLSILLIEAAIEDSLRSLFEKTDKSLTDHHPLAMLIHLFPPNARSNRVPEWIIQTAPFARHIAVLKLFPQKPPGTYELDWINRASSVWIQGGSIDLELSGARSWLRNNEWDRLDQLDPCGVLVRSNIDGKFVVTRISRQEIQIDDVYQLQVSSFQKRQRTPVSQLSTAVEHSNRIFFGINNHLYKKLCDKNILQSGWFKVQEGRKASYGIDRITISMFKDNLDKELENLSDELMVKNYRCRPLRRVFIPKLDGSLRAIGIACVRDRVLQTACLNLLEPIFDPGFSHFSFGYRPRRSAHHAISLARSMLSCNLSWIVCADIRKCFDSLDHDVLLDLISYQVNDYELLNLIRQWLTVDVFEFGEFSPSDMGVPQGESLSPLLANVYLDPLDKHLEKMKLNFIRYADDISIFTATEEEARKALTILGDFLHDPLKLELKPAKTNYVSIQNGFDFLGFRLDSTGIEVQQKKIEHVLKLLETILRRLAEPSSSLDQKISAFIRINGIIRGFRNYFLLPGEKRIFAQMIALDGRLEQTALSTLPTQIRDDPAWLSREKFSLPYIDPYAELERSTQNQLEPCAGEYAGKAVQRSGTGWAENYEDNEQRSKSGKETVLIKGEISDDDEADGRPGSNSVVKHLDRLYVLTHGSYLTIENDFLVVLRRKIEIFRCSLNELGLLYLQGIAMNISVNLQIRCAELDIPIVIAPPFGEPLAALNPIKTAKSHIRSQQVLRREDPDMIACGLSMIAAKVGNQSSVLKYFAKYRRHRDYQMSLCLNKAASEIREISKQIRVIDPGDSDVRSKAMGYEGYAATIYWKTIARLIPGGFSFEGRITRHAQDHINQCLNYVYGILYGEMWRVIVKNGLDPYFGLIHGSKRNQGSLVFDIIEEYRAPFADRLVLAMLGRGYKPEIGSHGFLRTKSKKLLAQAFARQWSKKIHWRSQTLTPMRILQNQIETYIQHLNHEDIYHPFRMRW